MKDDLKDNEHEILLLSLREPKVFEKIVERYQAPFLRKAVTILGDEETAYDVVQEAFVKIYINAEKFEERTGATLSAWAYKILINTCLSYYNKHKRERTITLQEETPSQIRVEIPEDSLRERFLSVLSRIPQGASKLLRYRVMEGKSVKEVAKLENLSEGVVRVRLHRAKNAFRRALVENPYL